MAQTVGIHTIKLLPGVENARFEKFMTEEAFPAAADAPGSVSRGGRSTIQSQHLLRSGEDQSVYLWMVKNSGVFTADLFERVVDSMYDGVREQLEALATRQSSAIFELVDSFEAGPRDSLGRPTGNPVRGGDM